MDAQKRIKTSYSLYGAIVFLGLTAVARASVEAPLEHVPEATVSGQLQRALTRIAVAPHQNPVNHTLLEEFYLQRAYQPAWCDVNGISLNAQRWLSVLAEVRRDGMNAPLLHQTEIQKLLNAAGPTELAMLDMLLSDSFLQYVNKAGQGVLPASFSEPKWYLSKPEIDPVALLETALQSGHFKQVIRSLEPRHHGYQRLRDKLSSYLLIQELGGWPEIQLRGPRLEPGMEHEEIQVLRERLWTSGDLSENNFQGLLYDPALEQAVRRFQQRHGLNVDGVVGRSTRAALAVSLEERIRQIRINLERWRWLPEDLGERYITVNTAGFKLQVHEGNDIPLEMRVIVGKKQRETPVFMEKMRYLVVNPYWRVPSKIAKRDLIPALLRDPDYFSRKGIRVLSDWQSDAIEVDSTQVAWQDYLGERYMPYQLRQDPGPQNSLGRIKFMLPNPHSVYLHDTPARHLFDKTVRTFSSGCIRVERPLALANYVLGSSSDGRQQTIEEIIQSGDTRTVPLPTPIPVYMLYQTAWVDGDGSLHFSGDVYQRDQRFTAAMPVTHPVHHVPQNAKNASGIEPLSLLQ